MLQHGILRIADPSSAATDQGNPEGTAEEISPKKKKPRLESGREQPAGLSPCSTKKASSGEPGRTFLQGVFYYTRNALVKEKVSNAVD